MQQSATDDTTAPRAAPKSRNRFAESLRQPARASTRTAVGRHVRAYRADWEKRLGGTLTTEQRSLLDLVCQLKTRTVAMDIRAKADGYETTGHDAKTYLSWANSLTRAERELRALIPKAGPKSHGALMAELNALVREGA